MTRKDISCLNYILGRLEGIAFAAEGNVRDTLLDTCERLAENIAAWEAQPFEKEVEA